MELGTDPADTPDSFLLRSLTTARSSDQDFRGTVLSGKACSPADSLLVVSIFFIRCRRLFREVIRPPASTSAAVSARSCRRVLVPGAARDRCWCTRVRRADTPNTTTGRFRDRVTAGRARRSTSDTQDVTARATTHGSGRCGWTSDVDVTSERVGEKEREREIFYF